VGDSILRVSGTDFCVSKCEIQMGRRKVDSLGGSSRRWGIGEMQINQAHDASAQLAAH